MKIEIRELINRMYGSLFHRRVINIKVYETPRHKVKNTAKEREELINKEDEERGKTCCFFLESSRGYFKRQTSKGLL